MDLGLTNVKRTHVSAAYDKITRRFGCAVQNSSTEGRRLNFFCVVLLSFFSIFKFFVIDFCYYDYKLYYSFYPFFLSFGKRRQA